MKEKQNLVERIKAFLNLGEDGKLQRFNGKLNKYFETQVKQRLDEIEIIEGKIQDLKEDMQEAVLSVDMDSLKGIDGTIEYCTVYVKNLNNQLDLLEELEAQKDDLLSEIERIDKLKAVIYE